MKNDLSNTIAAYHAERARQQKIGDIFAVLIGLALCALVLHGLDALFM